MQPTVGQKPLKYRLPPLAQPTSSAADAPIYFSGPARYGEWLEYAHDPEYFEVVHAWYAGSLRMVAGSGADDTPADMGHWMRTAEKPASYERWALMMLWTSGPFTLRAAHRNAWLTGLPQLCRWRQPPSLLLRSGTRARSAAHG